MAGRERVNLKGLHREMDHAGLDTVVAQSPDNFFYLSRVPTLARKIMPDLLTAVVVSRDGDPVALVFFVQEAVARRESWITDMRVFQIGDKETKAPGDARRTHMELLADALKERGVERGKIGIEEGFLPVRRFRELSAILPRATFVDAEDVFARARGIKTPAEVEILRRAARSTERAVLEAFQKAQVGDTERKVANDIRRGLFEAGADDFWMTLGAGSNVKVFDQYPGDKRLLPGEPVHLDGGGIFEGYYSNVARMALVAKPSSQQLSRYHWLGESMRNTSEHLRPGAAAGEVYAAAKATYDKAGYPMWSELAGHSIGVSLHEWPVLHAKDLTVLKPGMTVTVEQGLDDGHGSRFHVENLYLVTEGAPGLLSDYFSADDLFVIE